MSSTLAKAKPKTQPSNGTRRTGLRSAAPRVTAAPGRVGGFYSTAPVFGLGAIQAKMQPGAEPVEQEETSQAGVVQRLCPECAAESGGGESEEVQAKLSVTEPNDRFEREADSVADGVMRMADVEQEEESAPEVQTKPAISSLAGAGVQRKTELPQIPDATQPPAEETAPAPEEEAEPEVPEEAAEPEAEGEQKDAQVDLPAPEPLPPKEEPPPIQPRAQGAATPAPASVASVGRSLAATKGGGRPLAPGVQSHMERGFGRDFSGVRVHTDGNASRMNRELKARAFTHQNDIYFNAGEYRPESPAGQRLLAHELTHTVQQGAAGNTVQRWSAPPQDVATEPEPARPDDGAEVEGRMHQKIEDDERVQDQDELDEEEQEEAKNPNRGEVRQESSEIEGSGETKPSVDRPAAAQDKTADQAQEIEAEVTEQPAEAAEEEAAGEGEEAPLSAADAAAQRALAAQAKAQNVEIPPEPQPFQHPRIAAPVDSAGEPLPRNSQIDTQVRGLGYMAEMFREHGYEMKRHAAEQTIGSYALDSVLEREREDLANANEGTALIATHTEARKEIAAESRLAQAESVQRQQFVAATAPDLASKADEGSSDSGELAGEARSKADRSRGEIPDDEDARADAEEQAGEMESTASGAQSMDDAIRQTGERARQYEADAALAAEQNQQAEAEITATDDIIVQTETRIAEMEAENAESEAQIENAAAGPSTIRRFAQRTAQSGDELIAVSIAMETELTSIQDEYLTGMSEIEDRETATERQKREAEEAAETELSEEELTLIELAGMDEDEQEQRVAEMEQPERDRLTAALDRMIETTPADGAEEAAGAEGEEPADPRQPQIQAVEDRRTARVGGVLDVADLNMNVLTKEQQQMLANRLVAESITDDIANISVLQMGKDMIRSMIDPRESLTAVVGGFKKIGSGLANIGNWDAWQKDPLGNLLKIASDISTGLATIFSTILGIAAIITAIMVALTIISWGFLSPVTVPVITWMGTIMTYAGWGAIITGALSVYFNYLSYIKNLHDAGTAETAREVFGNVDEMKTNVTDGFQGASAVAAGIGGVKMGGAIRSGAFLRNMPTSPGAWARQTLQNARAGISAIAAAPAALARGARALFSGGRRGLIQFKNRVTGLFRRRRPGQVDFDVDTPDARRRHASELEGAQDKPLNDLTDSEFRAETRELANSRPKTIEADSPHFRDYDVELEVNGHKYRRRRDNGRWCRFSSDPKDCWIEAGDLPPDLQRRVRHMEEDGELFDETRDADLEDLDPDERRIIEESDRHYREELDFDPDKTTEDIGVDISDEAAGGQKTKPPGEEWKQTPNWEKWTKESGGTIQEHADGSVTLTDVDGNSVRYNPHGEPDFTPHMDHDSGVTEIDIPEGFADPPDRAADFQRANELAGHPEWGREAPPGGEYTWHHTRTSGRLQLVRRVIHDRFGHSGGIADLK